MTAEVLRLRIDIDSGEAVRNLERFEDAANDAERAATRLERAGRDADDSIRGLGRSAGASQRNVADLGARLGRVTTLLGAAAVAAIAAGAGLALREAIEGAANLQELNNRLRLVTESEQELIDVRERLFEVSQRNFSSNEATVDLYSRLARSTEDLGLSQERLLGVTETINQTIALSGASAESAQAALFQLGQGLGAGALRGEELNSVLEQTPELARAIADGLGVTIGELRTLGAEGELTAERVIGALEASGDAVAEQFGSLEPTLAQVNQQFSNTRDRLLAIAGADSVDRLSESVSGLNEVLSDPEVAADAARIGEAVQGIAASAVDLVANLIENGALTALADGFTAISESAAGIRELASGLAGLVEPVGQLASFVTDNGLVSFIGDGVDVLRGVGRGRIDEQQRQEIRDEFDPIFDELANDLDGALAEAAEEAREAARQFESAGEATQSTVDDLDGLGAAIRDITTSEIQEGFGDTFTDILGQFSRDLSDAPYSGIGGVGQNSQRRVEELLRDLADRDGIFEGLEDEAVAESIRRELEEGGDYIAEQTERAIERGSEQLARSLSSALSAGIENLIFEGGRGIGDILSRSAQNIFSQEIIGPAVEGIFDGQGLSSLTDALNGFSLRAEGVASGLGASSGVAGTIGAVAPFAAAVPASVNFSTQIGRSIDGNGISADTERFTRFGGIVGGAIGGLVSRSSDNFGVAIGDANNGQIISTRTRNGSSESRQNLSDAEQVLNATTDVTSEIARIVGGAFVDNPNTDGIDNRLRVTDGDQNGLRLGIATASGDDRLERSFTDPEDAIAYGVELSLRSLEGGNRQLVEFAERLNDAGVPMDELLTSLDVFAQAIDTGDDAIIGYAEAALESGRSAEVVADGLNSLQAALAFTVDEVTEVEAAINTINEAFDPVIEDMRALGQATDDLAASQQSALNAVGADFIETIQDEIANFANPTAAAFEQLLEAQETVTADARRLFDEGAISESDLGLVDQRNSLQLANFIDNLDQDQLNELGDYFGLIRENGGDAAVALFRFNQEMDSVTESLSSGLQDIRREADAFLAASSANSQLSEQISRELSGQTGGQQVLTLRGELESLRTEALGGSLEAAEAAPDVARELVAIAEQQFQGSAQLGDVRDFTTGVLDDIAAASAEFGEGLTEEADTAEQQLDVLSNIEEILANDPSLEYLADLAEGDEIQNALLRDLLDEYVQAANAERAATNISAGDVSSVVQGQFGGAVTVGNVVQTDSPGVVVAINAQTQQQASERARAEEQRDQTRIAVEDLTEEFSRLREALLR